MHRNAPLTPEGRLRLCHRIASGWSVTAAAESMNISRQTAHKWWGRYRRDGAAGLTDRSSRPHRVPLRTASDLERQILALRRTRKLGPARIAGILKMPASTVHRVLVRHGCNRLSWMDRPTGRLVRRIETSRPGELVHIDVKKLARIPRGGGHRMLGQVVGRPHQQDGTGYAHLHSAIDAHSRLAYSEFGGPESAQTCVGFLERAMRFFAGYGIRIERILTDNGVGYRSTLWAQRCGELGIAHTRTKPYHPATNGKAERYNRTLLDEWAYVRFYASDQERAATLDGFLHAYNHHRYHTAVGGPPISRVNNVSGDHT
jgi:transposase InsO family protein